MGQFASSAKSLRKSERPTNYDTNSPTGNLSCFKPFGGISTFSIGGHMKKKLGRIFCILSLVKMRKLKGREGKEERSKNREWALYL